MFVGCSEISISVIVKRVQDVGIIRGFCLPGGDLLSFSVAGETEKIAGSRFARTDQYLDWHYDSTII